GGGVRGVLLWSTWGAVEQARVPIAASRTGEVTADGLDGRIPPGWPAARHPAARPVPGRAPGHGGTRDRLVAVSTPMNNSLPWPTGAEVLPLASVRPVLDRLSSLVTTHEEDAALIPGLAVTEEEVAAAPPPALEQIGDELGGVRVCWLTMLTLQIEDRTDVGPYTLLGPATSFYPLYETPEAAVVLALDEDGAPGAVYGIGEDLALQLAAEDLPGYLERFADALEIVLTALATRGPAAEDAGTERAEAAQQLMDEHLFAQIL